MLLIQASPIVLSVGNSPKFMYFILESPELIHIKPFQLLLETVLMIQQESWPVGHKYEVTQ